MDSEITAPDGGWGWMVVLGAAMINMVNQALFSVFGLVFGEELKEMAHGKATGITLVMAISVCVTNFSGLAVGPMMRHLDVRSITSFGILCVGSGMIISSFSTEIWHIVIGYGIFTGLGLGLVASATFLAINENFTKRKSTAVGLSMAGTSIGQMIMPLFVGVLLKKFEFSGTTLILGILSYSGLIGALLFKPIFCCRASVKNKKSTDEQLEKSQYDMNCNDNACRHTKNCKESETQKLLEKEKNIIISKVKTIEEIERNVKENRDQIIEGDTKVEPIGCFTRIRQSLGLGLLLDFKFVHILVGLGLGYVSSVSFSTFFPMFLQDQVNFSMWETTSCMTALSAADIAGRMTISEICRRLKMGNRISFMVGAILLAISRSCLVELTSYKYVLAASIITGYTRAATVINQNLVISEYIQDDKLPSAIGLNMVAKGFFVMSVGEPLGMLKDAFDYGTCIHLLDIILIVVVVSWSMEYAITRKCIKRPK